MKTFVLPPLRNYTLLVISIFLLFSCGKEKISSAGELVRNDLLQTQDVAAQKQAYKLLTENEQKEVWLDKIQQILTQDLKSSKVKPRILNLRQVIKNTESGTFNKKNKKLMGIGLELAEVLPRNDFLGMFCTISDYSPFDVIESNCMDCKDDIKQSMIDDMNDKPKISLRWSSGKPLCNCKWTCELNTLTTGFIVIEDCEETYSGCGWLWLQPCTKRVDSAGPRDRDHDLEG